MVFTSSTIKQNQKTHFGAKNVYTEDLAKTAP